MESLGGGTGGDDEGVGGDWLLVLVELGPELEWSGGEVDLGDSLCDDVVAELDGLLSHAVHELTAHETVWETGEVLNLGGGGQLAAGSDTVGHHTLVHGGRDLSAAEVDGGGVGGRAGTNDSNLVVNHCDVVGVEVVFSRGSKREKP